MSSDAELGRLAELDYWTWIEAFDGTPGVRVVIEPDVRYRVSDVDHDYLNQAFAASLDPAAADQRIREVIATLGRGRRAFYWSVWPSDRPTDLVDRLVAAGFEDDGRAPLMAVRLADAPDPGPLPDELEIRRVDDAAALDEISAFVASSLDGPPDRVRPFAATFERLIVETDPRVVQYVGSVDGRPVTAGALFTGSGVAGIYGVMTAEDARGRGYGRAITAAAMDEGRRRGLEVSVLMASPLGEPVYRRLGFRDVGRVAMLRWPGGMPR